VHAVFEPLRAFVWLLPAIFVRFVHSLYPGSTGISIYLELCAPYVKIS
jgi:hypothetical protein